MGMTKCNGIVVFAIEVAAEDFYHQWDGDRINYMFGQHGLECAITDELKREYHVGFTRVESDRTIYLFYPLESLQKSMFGSPGKLNIDNITTGRVEQWKDELHHAFDEILQLQYSEPAWYVAAEAIS